MKGVYELWSFCIHSLHRMVPASADLVDPADLADLADPVDLADLADPAVPRPWDPQSPVLRRN